eukprot:PITA_14867
MRKQSTRNRGTFRGRGCQGGRGRSTTPRDGASSNSSQHAPIGGDASGKGSFSKGRGGRGRGREIRCYRCNKLEHKAYECPENIGMDQRNEIVEKTEEEATKVIEEENVPEKGESLVVNKILLKLAKEIVEPEQRKTLFRTVCKVQGKCCQMIIDSGSTDNLVSTEVVEKLKLKTKKHPTPYKVSWIQKGYQLVVNEQCEVELQLGKYRDKIMCDVMPMDVCHILLGRPWQYDRGAMHDGKKNTSKFSKDGVNHTLMPIEEEDTSKKPDPKTLLLSGKKYLQQMEEDEVIFALVCKPKVIITSTKVYDLPIEIQEMLDSYCDIIVDDLPDELPPIRKISRHIDLIPGENLPNKAAYKMTPIENEEIKKQVQELLDKGLIRESFSPCAVPTVLSPKKYGGWRMCTGSRAITKITISKSKEEHVRHLNYVLQRLQQEKLLLNLKKFSFMKEELVYLGFVVYAEGLNMDPEKIKAIIGWPSPKGVFEVRSFHGLASFYRKFIRNFSKINASIIDTIKKDRQPFKWIAEEKKNFHLLKRKIIEKLILIFPDFNIPFQVKCDASGESIGAILSQEGRLVAYFSEKINESKRKYSSYDKEFYAVVQSLKKWGHYLMSKEFILYSDNHALQYIMQHPKLN